MKQLLLSLLATLPGFLFSQALIHETHPLQRLVNPFDFPANPSDFQVNPSTPYEMPHLDDLIERLEMKRIALGYPGMFFTIVTPQQVLWEGGMGEAHLDTQKPVDIHTQFRLGSITKGIIALGILKLVEEGHFTLASKLRDLAPEIPFTNPYAKTHPLRVHQLLEHTTGFEEMHLNALFNIKDDPDLPLIDRIHKSKASLISRWEPGTKHAYCNPGYLIAGYLIEKYSGMPYDEYLQQKIMRPSGMLYSGFQNRISPDENIATGYRFIEKQWVGSPYYSLYSSPSGGLNAGAYDMARYLQLLLNEGNVGGRQIISKESIARMEHPGETEAVKCGLKKGYGLGNYTHYSLAPFPLQAHGGAMEGFSSNIAYSRELGIGYALSVNASVNLGPLVEIIIQYIQQHYAFKIPPVQPLDPKIPTNYTGYYELQNPSVELLSFQAKLAGGIYLYESEGNMHIRSVTNWKSPILPVSNHTFRFPHECGPTSVFCHNNQGEPVFMTGSGMDYFKKTSDTTARYLRIAFGASILLLITLIPVSLVWFIMLLFGRIKRGEVVIRFSPVVAFGLLFVSQYLLNHILEHILFSGILTVYTGGFYFATLGFAFFSLLSMSLVMRDFGRFNNLLVPVYLFLCGLALTFITSFFWYYGLIGIRFWAY